MFFLHIFNSEFIKMINNGFKGMMGKGGKNLFYFNKVIILKGYELNFPVAFCSTGKKPTEKID